MKVSLCTPLVTLATEVGGVSLLRDVATLDETKPESYLDAELDEPLPLPPDSSDDLSSGNVLDLKWAVVSASLLTLFRRTSFILFVEQAKEASALWAEATREM